MAKVIRSKRRFGSRILPVMAIVVVVILSLFMLSACSSSTTSEQADSDTRVFTDLTGAEVELPVEIESVIHLWPASTAMQVFLGEGDTIIGTLAAVQNSWGWLTAACPSLMEVTAFASDATAEELLAMDPDVVITSSSDTAESLREAGVPAVCMLGDQESVEALEEFTLKMGELLGSDATAKAEEYCAFLDEMVEIVTEATSTLSDDDRISLYYNSAQHSESPYATCGANYITQTWMDICGVDNIAVDLVEGGDVEISMEEIVAADPDYILVGGTNQEVALETIFSDAAWQSLTAVADGNVIANPQGVMKWEKFGPEFAIQIVWFTQQVYPDLLTDIDIQEYVTDFYSTWYGYELTDELYEQMMSGASGPTE